MSGSKTAIRLCPNRLKGHSPENLSVCLKYSVPSIDITKTCINLKLSWRRKGVNNWFAYPMKLWDKSSGMDSNGCRFQAYGGGL